MAQRMASTILLLRNRWAPNCAESYWEQDIEAIQKGFESNNGDFLDLHGNLSLKITTEPK
jgi:hypothetical protein